MKGLVRRASYTVYSVRIIALCVALFAAVTVRAAADDTTILIVGDSLSAGYQLPAGSGWVDLLARELAAAHITVINDSISGDTTAGGVARLPAALRRINPDWVVIELGGNDGLRGASLVAMARNLSEMVRLTRAHGAKPILLGMKLPPNYGAQYTAAFEEVYRRVAAGDGDSNSDSNSDRAVPLLPFFMHGIENNPTMFQHDGIHPTRAAQKFLMRNVLTFLGEVIERG